VTDAEGSLERGPGPAQDERVGVLQPPAKVIEALGPVERTFGPAGIMRWWPLLSGLGFGAIGVALVVSTDGFAEPMRWVGLGIVLVVATAVALYPPGRVTVHERGLAARTWLRWIPLRWEDVVSVHLEFIEHYTSAGAMLDNSPLYSTKMCHLQRRGYRMALALSNLGVREVDQLIRIVDQHTRARLESEAWAAAKADGSDHGWFTLHDLDGISFGSRDRHVWAEIASYSVADGNLVLSLANGEKREIPLRHVANPHAAMAIIATRARVQLRWPR
jgi:hypothetical protein